MAKLIKKRRPGSVSSGYTRFSHSQDENFNERTMQDEYIDFAGLSYNGKKFGDILSSVREEEFM